MEEKKLFKKIKKVLAFAWNNKYSSFYKEKYKKAGINPLRDIKNLNDFASLPFLTREEILRTDPYDRIFVPKEKIYKVKMSSGTSHDSDPMIIFRNKSNAKEASFRNKMGKHGASMCMILSHVFGAQGRLIWKKPARLNDAMFVLGDRGDFSLSAKIAKTLKVDALQASATYLMFFIPYIEKYYDPLRIRYVRVGGEFCSEAKAQYFQEVFPNAFIDFSFASTELNSGGYRCSQTVSFAPRFFHSMPHHYREYIHPNEESESVVTDLRVGVAFPVIRYRTGDTVVLSDKVCGCGKKLIEVFGKINYDVVRISGTTIYANEVAKALAKFKDDLLIPDFQLHIYELQKKKQFISQLVLNVISKSGKRKDALNKLKAQMEKQISENLYVSSTLTLEDLTKRGVFMPLVVEFVDSLPFTGKRKHFVSHVL